MNKILLVDDHQTNLMILEVVLEGIYETLSCQTGQEALQIMEREAIDLVITDLKMPGMDGFELTQKIRQIRPKVPVIAISAHTGLLENFREYKAGFDDFIAKPFSIENLKQKVTRHLQKTTCQSHH